MENWIQSGDAQDRLSSARTTTRWPSARSTPSRPPNLLDTVFVGGVDATSDALAAMQAGDLEVTVFQDAERPGQGGVDAAVTSSSGETVPDYVVDIPYVLVTPANIADYLGAN